MGRASLRTEALTGRASLRDEPSCAEALTEPVYGTEGPDGPELPTSLYYGPEPRASGLRRLRDEPITNDLMGRPPLRPEAYKDEQVRGAQGSYGAEALAGRRLRDETSLLTGFLITGRRHLREEPGLVLRLLHRCL